MLILMPLIKISPQKFLEKLLRALCENLYRSDSLSKLAVAHIASLGKSDVHLERVLERVRSVQSLTLRQLQIIPEKLLVVWVGAVLDDEACTLRRTLSAQVGNTLLCNDYANAVL